MQGRDSVIANISVWRYRSFVVGALPLTFTLSPSQLRFISSLGMGVLVGTALVIIIPEGVETLYSSQHKAHSSVQSRALDVTWPHQSVPGLLPRDVPEILNLPGPVIPDVASTGEFAPDRRSPADEDSSEKNEEDKHHDEDEAGALHAWIGISLVSGFILMYLIDRLPAYVTPPKPRRLPYHISLDNLGASSLRRSSSPTRGEGVLENDSRTQSSNNHSFAMTTGLVIHAAADGIALGASGSNSSLSFIIFLALLVHKAPAAFGLTSVLLKHGLSSRAARGHLLVFSLAAPVGAILTFLAVQTLGSGVAGDESSHRWRTGVLLLFSAGTFLLVILLPDFTLRLSDYPANNESQQIRGHAYHAGERSSTVSRLSQ